MTAITDEYIDCWKINYGLDKMSPADAARWWEESANGMAPAGAVVALGLVLQERETMLEMIRGQAAALERLMEKHNNLHMTAQELRKDAGRLDWIAAKLEERSGVWMLPCGESLRFVQLRHFGDRENYPTAEGLRAAIDAAMAESASNGPAGTSANAG